ncbi:MAG TPA: D-alanyl-D-alanine carboxypeptidase [Candidatus Eisenbacteria bacterium]|nr:D-alanyl-D-alanine carboxypeptidase [Candidatus Eisenbacteria bacterium]
MRGRGAAVCGLIVATALGALGAEPPLQSLAREHVGADQGVFAQAEDGTVLVAQVEDRAVHPASVTKIATALALVERLGADHRFTTRFVATTTPRDGRLDGDLVVEGGNDPFFVYESAFLVLRRLHEMGLRTVAGRVDTRGVFLFNWQPDPGGVRLLRALRGADGAEAWAALGDPQTLAAVALRFSPGRKTAGSADDLLVTLRSPILLHVLKTLSGYSNNVYHYASDAIGGPHAVETIAKAHVSPELRDQIVIDNGAGAGTTNRLSPRVAVALLRALEHTLVAQHHELVDVLPVSGVDPGTLKDRLLDHRRYVVGKTGTFGSVGASGLAGILRSKRYGTVAFAVLNHNVPVPDARARQDAFVRALIDATDAEAWPYDTPMRPTYLEAIVE